MNKIPSFKFNNIIEHLKIKNIYLVSGDFAAEEQKDRCIGSFPYKKWFCELSWTDTDIFTSNVDGMEFAVNAAGDSADNAMNLCITTLFDLAADGHKDAVEIVNSINIESENQKKIEEFWNDPCWSYG